MPDKSPAPAVSPAALHPGYMPEIDGLRAIAVLAVVLCHASGMPMAGFAGVDIFFVISGYLITRLLLAEQAASGTIVIAGFYARRTRRILPALAVMVLVTLGLSAFFLAPAEMRELSRSAMPAMLFCANIFFQMNSGGYFHAASDTMPLLHLWSLGVEEQFYLLWPLLLVVLLRSPLHASRPQRLWKTIALLCALSFLLSEVLLLTSPDAAFFQLPSRFWELAAGGLVAALSLPSSLPPSLRSFLGRLGLPGLSLAVASLFIPLQHFPGAGALPAVIGTALLLFSLQGGPVTGVTGFFLRLPVMAFFGRISYSLYLWHWPLLALYRASSLHPAWYGYAALCALATLLAFLSYRYVEQPFRYKTALAAPARVLVTGMTAVLAMVCVSGFAMHGAAARIVVQDERYPEAYRVEHDVTVYRENCQYQPSEAVDVFPKAGCESVAGKAASVAMLGDSYGAAWQPLAWEIARQGQLSAVDYTRSGCPVFLKSLEHARARDKLCRKFNARVAASISGFDTLVIGTRWDAWPLAVHEKELRETLAQLSQRSKRILVIGPTPVMNDTVPSCMRRQNLSECAVLRKDFEATASPVRERLLAIAADYPNVEYVEVADFFCAKLECPPMKDGMALYSDESHVSRSAAGKFSAEFTAQHAMP
jgi:peptidoglycan/LPS O-acetylase OafA/YrhL